jgi:hypothetical protein
MESFCNSARARDSEESFFLRFGQNANAVTIKLVLIDLSP